MSRQARWGANLAPSTTDNAVGGTTSNKRTAAQLEKKRAQDRDSQRNVRQRTKQHIAKLEAQLEELVSPDCVSRLLKANEELQKRNDELTAILRSMSQLANQAISPSAESSGSAGQSLGNGEARSPTVHSKLCTKGPDQLAPGNGQCSCYPSHGRSSELWTAQEHAQHDNRNAFREHRTESLASNLSLASAGSEPTVELPNTVVQLLTNPARDCWSTPVLYALQKLDSNANERAKNSIPNDNGFEFKNYDWLAPDFIGPFRE